MMVYLLVKYLHVLGAIVILGTGTGIAFFMLMAHLSRNAAVVIQVRRQRNDSVSRVVWKMQEERMRQRAAALTVNVVCDSHGIHDVVLAVFEQRRDFVRCKNQ